MGRIWFLCLCVFLITVGSALASPARVLLVLSYDPGLSWSQEQIRGVQGALSKMQPSPELHIEYMDSKRFHSPDYFADLARLYRNKYQSLRPDLLIVCDNNALDFVLDSVSDLFRNIPLIFCGINNFSDQMLRGRKLVTGVAEDLSFKETLQLAMQLHPRTKHMVVYGVPTKTYELNKQRLIEVETELGWQNRISFIEGLKFPDIERHIKQLDKDSLVLLTSTLLDEQGVAMPFESVADKVWQVSPVPVYSFWRFFITSGATGGRVVSGYEQGSRAGKMAARILAGEAIDQIPIQLVSPNPVVFSSPQMQKFNILDKDLPAGTEIINRPEDYWSQHPKLFWAGGSGFAVLVMICVMLIIDSRRRSRLTNQLRTAHDFLQSVIDGVAEPLLVIAPDYSVLLSNKAARLHMNSDQSLKSHCYSLSHGVAEPCNSEDHPCPLPLVLNTLQPARVQHLHLGKGDKKVHCDILASPIFDAAGDLTCVVESVRDISGLIEAQSEVRSERNRLEVTLRSIGDGVVAVDQTGAVTLINPVAEKLTGWRQDEALGQAMSEIFQIIDEETRQPVSNPVDEVISSGVHQGLENHTLLVHRDGSERAIADSAAPILDPVGKLAGVVLVFRDVTTERQAEQEKVRAQQLESIGLLAGGIAHDFNNLLMGIRANLELLGRRVAADERIEKYITQAKRAVERSADLTSQLLTFAKGGDPVREEFSLAEQIEDWISFSLLGSNCDYRLRVAGDLPSLWADLGQIRQVVSNLVINAKQAMSDGGRIEVAIRVEVIDEQEVSQLPPGRYICVEVADSGPGISVEQQTLIFNPYYTTKSEGNGLGLATAYSIMRRHDGYLTVSNRKQGGAIFSLYLPIRDRVSVLAPAVLATQIGSSSLRLLVMDDEEILRSSLEGLLLDMGHGPVVVADGKAAIELYQKDKFDAVILDLTVPGGMGGKQTLLHLARLDPGVSAIASSGYAEDPIIANPQQYGFIGALIKPYGVEQIDEILAQIRPHERPQK